MNTLFTQNSIKHKQKMLSNISECLLSETFSQIEKHIALSVQRISVRKEDSTLTHLLNLGLKYMEIFKNMFFFSLSWSQFNLQA